MEFKEKCKHFLPGSEPGPGKDDIPTPPLVSLQPADREVNTFMHNEEKPVGCEDTKTETSSTGLASTTVPEQPPSLTDTNTELEDYTGTKELFVEPD